MSDWNLLNDFLSPVSEPIQRKVKSSAYYRMGAVMQIHMGELPNPDGIKVALIGVKEDRGSVNNTGTAQAVDSVREQFYDLSCFDTPVLFADFGDIKPGATLQDTYVAVSKVCGELIKKGIIPIVIGGSHDITYGQFLAYEEAEQMINVVVADSRLDFTSINDSINSQNFLSDLFTYRPNFLQQFTLMGHQTYFVEMASLQAFDELGFETYRLGDLQEENREMEPVLRDADLVSLDISCVRSSDAPGNGNIQANGFFGNEVCRLARYAGMSDKVSSFGIYELNPLYDNRGHTAQLAAQIIWYFIDGVLNRKGDYPVLSEDHFYKYIVHIESQNSDIVFLKSRKSDRWWMKVPQGNMGKHKLVSCTYADYQTATTENYPDRWMRALG